MKIISKFMLLTLVLLLVSLGTISATDNLNDTAQTADIGADTDITTDVIGDASADNDEDTNQEKTIQKKDVTETVKQAKSTITITNDNYETYFVPNGNASDLYSSYPKVPITKTSNLVKNGDVLDLQGTFDNIHFGIDKNITLTSTNKNVRLNNCIVIVLGSSANGVKIYNLTINNTKEEYAGIVVDNAKNVLLQDNNVTVNGVQALAVVCNSMNNSVIKSNYLKTAKTGTGSAHSVLCMGRCYNNIIQDNYVTSEGATLINLYNFGKNFYRAGESYYNNITHNTLMGAAGVDAYWCNPISMSGSYNIISYNDIYNGMESMSIGGTGNKILYNNLIAPIDNAIAATGDVIIEHNNITMCDLVHNDSGKAIELNIGSDGSIIHSNRITSVNGVAFIISASNIQITKNIIKSNKDGIYAQGIINNIVITGNRIETTGAGINITTSQGGLWPKSNHLLVTDNTIKSQADYAIDLRVTGNKSIADTNVTVTNNTLRSGQGTGLSVTYLMPMWWNAITTTTLNSIPSIYYGDNMTVTGKVTAKLANNTVIDLINAKVTVKINDEQTYTATTDENGIYTLTTNRAPAGNNTITVVYGGFNNYNTSSISTASEVYKQDLKLTLNSIADNKFADYYTVTGKFTDINNVPIQNSKVKVSVNGKVSYAPTNNKGVYSITFKSAVIGKNNVTVGYGGSNNYNPANNVSKSFMVTKKDLVVTLNKINNTKFGDNYTVSGTFTDENNVPMAKSKVKITINGKVSYALADSDGVYSFTVRAATIGVNNVTVGYDGAYGYNAASSVSKTFTISKQDLVVTLVKINNTKYGDNYIVTGTFKDVNGNPMAKSKVKITINGKVSYALADSDGVYSFTVRAATIGVNNVTVGYDGAYGYNAAPSVSKTFTISKQDLNITVDKINNTKYGNNFTITGRFTDINGNPMKNSKVKLTINGKVSYVLVDDNGFYTFSAKATVVGVNNVTAGYAGTYGFNSFATNTTFTVTRT